ncbi:MAG: hypothetical protein WAU88_03930 [Candidatus Zixiibacteriota bacterium]
MARKYVCLAMAVAVIWLLVLPNAYAQWSKTTMPDGGVVYGLAAVNTSLFAATENGVFRSDDYGASWSATTLTNAAVKSITSKDGYLIVGRSGGVSVSTDLGVTWTPKNIPGTTATMVLSSASDGIWAGTSDESHLSFVWYSTNYGDTWQQVADVVGSNYTFVNAIEADSLHVYVGTPDGLYATDRSNGTFGFWYQFKAGPYLYGLALTNAKVYAAGWYGAGALACPIISQLKSLGSTGLGNTDLHDVFIDGPSLYACSRSGLYRSVDTGTTWSLVGLDHTDVYGMIRFGGRLFAAAGSGVAQSLDDGLTWTVANNGLKSEGLYSILPQGDTIIVGTPSGVFRSADQGATWTSIGLQHDYVFCLAAEGTDLYAGTRNGLFRSSDNGASWTPLAEGMSQSTYSMIVTPSVIVRSGYFSNGVYHSVDQGATWSFNNTLPYWLVSYASLGSTLLQGWQGVMRSTDQGTTWTYNSSDPLAQRYISHLKSVGSNVYAATGNRVYVSSDTGLSWTSISSGLSTAQCKDLTTFGSTLVASTYNGLFTLSNGQSTWLPVSTDGLADRRITASAIAGNRVFSITQAGRIGEGIDGGRDLWTLPLENLLCCHGTTGNVNLTGGVDLADLSALVLYLTGGDYVLPCASAANVNGQGSVDLSDLSAMVAFLTGAGFDLPSCS